MFQQDRSTRLAIRSLMILALCAGLFSFSERVGGDTFAIYLNDRLLLQERVLPATDVKTVRLSGSDANSILKIHYSHCGQIGTGRTISITGSDKKVLKTWVFPEGSSSLMHFAAKEILALKKGSGNQPMELRYSSSELKEGKVLAAIILPDDTRASIR